MNPLDIKKRSLDQIPNFPERQEPVGFILRLAKALHSYGVPGYELEQTIINVANQIGFGIQCLSLPTSITMTLTSDDSEPQTFVVRVSPGEIHLHKLYQVSRIAAKSHRRENESSKRSKNIKIYC